VSKTILATSTQELENCFKIRSQVFVDEQNVPKDMERDEYDSIAFHFLSFIGSIPIGTARVVLLEDGDTAKIGRVAILQSHRSLGLGIQLMSAIEIAPELSHCRRFTLQAQTHALKFYKQLGYVEEGPEFLDAGIPHREMTKSRVLG
jgi:predicted GNAT family N-acyltransferase